MGEKTSYSVETVKIGKTVRHVNEMKKQKDTERNSTVAHWLFAQATHVDAATYGFVCVVISRK